MSDVTQADKDAVSRFHAIQIKRIMAADRTLGDNRGTIELAFAAQRLRGIEEGKRLSIISQDAGTGWASPALGRAYLEVERVRHALAQPSESDIDNTLRLALEAIETADCELAGVAS